MRVADMSVVLTQKAHDRSAIPTTAIVTDALRRRCQPLRLPRLVFGRLLETPGRSMVAMVIFQSLCALGDYIAGAVVNW
jgi:hypothetical protein